jgi:hypothetical protein
MYHIFKFLLKCILPLPSTVTQDYQLVFKITSRAIVWIDGLIEEKGGNELTPPDWVPAALRLAHTCPVVRARGWGSESQVGSSSLPRAPSPHR